MPAPSRDSPLRRSRNWRAYLQGGQGQRLADRAVDRPAGRRADRAALQGPLPRRARAGSSSPLPAPLDEPEARRRGRRSGTRSPSITEGRVELPKVLRGRAGRLRGPHLGVPSTSRASCSRRTVRRTLAPRGETPILQSWDRHDRISAISAITVSPRRRRVGLYFHLLPDDTNVHGEDVVGFLRELRRQLPVPMTVLWDKGNASTTARRSCGPTWRSRLRRSRPSRS